MENDKTPQPGYFSITPAEVRYCKDLADGAKLLYGEITALSNKQGYCFASNGYFSELYGNDDRTIRRWVSALEKHGFVNVLISGKNRRIYPIIAAKQEVPPLTEEDAPASAPAAKKAAKKAPKEKKPRVSLKFEPVDMQLSQLLHDRIVVNFPHLANKKADLEAWANEMRMLREYLAKDKEAKAPAEDRITFMILWLQGGSIEKNGRTTTLPPHDFWAKNILSAAKLRAQWDEKLMPQFQVWMQQKVKKHGVADLSHPAAPQRTRPPERVAQL